MTKQELSLWQPIVYQTLANALRTRSYAHAYLLHGPKGTGKEAAALLFAQSILCKSGEDGFACERCDLCRRVAQGEYADFLWIDGSETSIKKADIVRLQELFVKTALEQDAHKIYVLSHVENATNDAMNALLKFLEEPVNGVVAILTSDQLESVMPTIVSRCQCIPFHALNRQKSYEQGIACCDAYDAYLLSTLHFSGEQMRQISESEDYQHARSVFFECVKRLAHSVEEATLFLQLEGYPAKSKKPGKTSFSWFLEMMIRYVKDCTQTSLACQSSEYRQLWEQAPWQREQLIFVLQILLSKKDLLRRSVNLALLADQMMAQLKEVKI